jgi:hypothetical protein
MPDWASERGLATEPNFDRFVASIGGARVDQRFGVLTTENADYVFEEQRILIELKIIETEFGKTQSFERKHTALLRTMARAFGAGQILRGEPLVAKFYAEHKLELFRAPLGRIAKKANRQIRETKSALGLEDFKGILFCVNDGLRELNVETVFSLLMRILNGNNSEISGFVYLTNHYVDIPGSKYANLLWVPAYADETDHRLSTFVNRLGGKWFDFCEVELGPAEYRVAGPDIGIAGARPITWPSK